MPAHKRLRHRIEIVKPTSLLVQGYLETVRQDFPLTYRIIFTKARLQRCRYAAIAIQEQKNKVSGIAGLNVCTQNDLQIPELSFVWVSIQPIGYLLDRRLLIILRDFSEINYGRPPGVTEILELCRQIQVLKPAFIKAREYRALGIAVMTEERLTSSNPNRSVFLAKRELEPEDKFVTGV